MEFGNAKENFSALVKAGMAKARRRGIKIGRPPTKPVDFEQALALKKKGYINQEIGKLLNVSKSTIQRLFKSRKK